MICLDCGMDGGQHEVTCAFADDACLPPPRAARVRFWAVVDGRRLVSATVPENTAKSEIHRILSERLSTRSYQESYAPVTALPSFEIER
jgi:hypothetical protein